MSFGFEYQENPIFQNVSLNLDDTWKLGLVGRNGRGKTVLLQLLMSTYSYHGTIKYSKEFVYFPVEINDMQQLTYYVLEEIASFEQWALERECQLLDVDVSKLWQPYETLSGGEKTKLLLAILFLDKGKFPLIDEPTNHLDIKSRKQVKDYLQKKSGYIIVSHDRAFLNEVIDHTLAIEREQIVLYQGNYETYVKQKQIQDNQREEKNNKLKKEIQRLEKTVKEKKEWGDAREQSNGGRNIAARLMKRVKAIDHRRQTQVEVKKGLLDNREEKEVLSMTPRSSYKKAILQLKDFSLGYEKGKYLFQPVTVTVNQGEQVAIVGNNGVGKTTLMRYFLQPEHFFTTGECYLAEELIISTVSQEITRMGTLKEFSETMQLDYTKVLTYLKKLGMERTAFETPIEKMSRGQQKKVELVKSILQKADLYLWDEPLNYLDLFAQEQLSESIEKAKPTMIFIEHDTLFCQKATKLVEIKAN